MTRKELKKLVWYIQRIPIHFKKLYWKKCFQVKPAEASRMEHSKWSKGKLGKRFYGCADNYRQKVYLDIGLCFYQKQQPLSMICRVLIHEVCHLAFNTHYVSKYEKAAVKHLVAWDEAEQRILKLLIRKNLK